MSPPSSMQNCTLYIVDAQWMFADLKTSEIKGNVGKVNVWNPGPLKPSGSLCPALKQPPFHTVISNNGSPNQWHILHSHSLYPLSVTQLHLLLDTLPCSPPKAPLAGQSWQCLKSPLSSLISKLTEGTPVFSQRFKWCFLVTFPVFKKKPHKRKRTLASEETGLGLALSLHLLTSEFPHLKNGGGMSSRVEDRSVTLEANPWHGNGH
jgi:hypothetical protein